MRTDQLVPLDLRRAWLDPLAGLLVSEHVHGEDDRIFTRTRHDRAMPLPCDLGKCFANVFGQHVDRNCHGTVLAQCPHFVLAFGS